MSTPRVLLPLATILVAANCSPPRFDPAAEQDRLLRRDMEWADAASAGKDLEKIVSYRSDDAGVIPPGQPVLAGKAPIRASVADSLQSRGFKIHWTPEKVVSSSDGKLAFIRGTSETTGPGP